jgi:hypothetical protein
MKPVHRPCEAIVQNPREKAVYNSPPLPSANPPAEPDLGWLEPRHLDPDHMVGPGGRMEDSRGQTAGHTIEPHQRPRGFAGYPDVFDHPATDACAGSQENRPADSKDQPFYGVHPASLEPGVKPPLSPPQAPA